MKHAAILLFAAVCVHAADPKQPTYANEIKKWRDEREATLKAPDGWLSVAGLFWLQPGKNRAGSAAGCPVALPSRAPADAGDFEVKGDKVEFHAAKGVPAILKGKPVQKVQLKPDSDEVLQIGDLKLALIKRGERVAIRMRDNESAMRRNFRGLQWYPPKPAWKVTARFVPQPKTMFFDSQTGDKQQMESPGYVEFTRAGKKFRLTPVQEDDRLFFVLRDKTAGKTTYAASRFLYADSPKSGSVILDFNKAYNPPCVFTPYATCPLPPPENRLSIPIEAGELMYKGQ